MILFIKGFSLKLSASRILIIFSHGGNGNMAAFQTASFLAPPLRPADRGLSNA
ncbi:hypothetical protein HMPREF1051_1694 [Neisseria sicca VK64]|uniref:Uncharacterized protein n=1 Tax=Neisseria sicca VK64 TaxID=1095748 RepID=I2NH00_NEISI|nr:hypothetical protein HMPREF1051_1694 [Neisseria sicca VK64]